MGRYRRRVKETYHADHFAYSYGESLDAETHCGTCRHFAAISSNRATAVSVCGKCNQWDSFCEAGNVCNFWMPLPPPPADVGHG